MIELTRIDRRRHGRTRLKFNTGETVAAPSRVINSLDLEEGQNYDLERLREDVHQECRNQLPDRARSHLAQYTKTTSEFVEHFTRKGYPEPLVREMVDRLQDEGVLDDDEIARRHVKRRLENKHYGRQKIIAELRKKGFDSGRARSIVDEFYPSELERRKAREYVNDNEGLDSRKLMSRLQSRGFSSSVIRDLVGFPN